MKPQMHSKTPPSLLVIVGPTASGKTALAIQLAERFGGEIVCADSRTVYRGLAIGTAKPTVSDLARVPHWGLDLAEPDERFTVADYKQYAEHIIADIAARGRVPIMVGGSGLYVDAVLYDYQLLPAAEQAVRVELAGLSVEQLQEQIRRRGLLLPSDPQNPRRLMRVIETAGVIGGAADRERGMRANTLVLGLDWPIEELERRIAVRVDEMLTAGLVDEVRRVGERYGWEAQALQAPGYRAFRAYIEGTRSLEEAKQAFVKNDRNLAKRQKTWFKRNKSIHWLTTEDTLAKSVDLVTTVLDT